MNEFLDGFTPIEELEKIEKEEAEQLAWEHEESRELAEQEQEKASNELAKKLHEMVWKGEAKVKETLWSSDDGDVCIVEWKGKEYGVFWIGNSSDWETDTPEVVRANVEAWKDWEEKIRKWNEEKQE